MNPTTITELTPLHQQILVDHVVDGLTIEQCADRHSVSKGMLYHLKKSDVWNIEAQSLIDSIKSDRLNKLSQIADLAIGRIEGILESKDSEDRDVLKAADSVLNRVLTKGATQKNKIIFNMLAPGWHSEESGSGESGENKNGQKKIEEGKEIKVSSGGNRVQIIMGDQEYK